MEYKTLLLLFLLASGFADAHADAHKGNPVYITVNGLVCDFCARALEKVFGRQKSVEAIDVDLDQKIITIVFKKGQTMDDERLVRLILDAGYNAVDIRREK